MGQQLKEHRQYCFKESIKPKQVELIIEKEYKFGETGHNISTTLHNSLNLTEIIYWILANIEQIILYHVFKTEEALTISDTLTWSDWVDMSQSGWIPSFISSPIWLQGKVAVFFKPGQCSIRLLQKLAYSMFASFC